MSTQDLERTEQAYITFVRALEVEEATIEQAISTTVHVINEGRLTANTRNALLDALADLEQTGAVFRWAAGNAAVNSRHAKRSDESDVRLLVHTRRQDALDYVEGHAIALIEVVARMRQHGEKRDDVLDVRQHTQRLVELGKSILLPRKPPNKRKR